MPADRPACTCVICHDYGDRDRLDRFQLRTIVHVTQYGWSVVLVPDDGESGPGWAYTIGLWHGHRAPELAMFGDDVYETEEILNRLGRDTAGGHGPVDGECRDGVVRGRPAAFRRVNPGWYDLMFDGAMAFYRRPLLPMLQIVRPDPQGLFPWQPGTDPGFRYCQPWLWLEPERYSPAVQTQRS